LPTLPDGAIRATNVWKRFRADRRVSQLQYETKYLLARVRRHAADDEDWRWALRAIDLDVQPGESIGLIGTNGSGKSTLLKILNRVMQPYAGRVDVSGRVGALIEVVAGIHPDLSGRENAFLYGSLLGLDRAAIAARFDEIVEFSEVGHAIDRQVKFYSSGMKMRLGFSVAAFLEPDILLVDEVLAVGDAAFQQKCLERMRVVLNQGTTLVFVSHDLAAMEATCSRGLWIQDGVGEMNAPIRTVLAAYRRAIEEAAEAGWEHTGPARVSKVEAIGPDGGSPRSDEETTLVVRLQCESSHDAAHVHVGVSEGPATPIFVLRNVTPLAAGETIVRCTIPHLPLPRGRFYLWIGVSDGAGNDLVAWHPAGSMDVIGSFLDPAPHAVVRLSPIYVPAQWDVER
jgi:ABC-type polysaccharide/polyol phosphate transport system ATPase subunit